MNMRMVAFLSVILVCGVEGIETAWAAGEADLLWVGHESRADRLIGGTYIIRFSYLGQTVTLAADGSVVMAAVLDNTDAQGPYMFVRSYDSAGDFSWRIDRCFWGPVVFFPGGSSIAVEACLGILSFQRYNPTGSLVWGSEVISTDGYGFEQNLVATSPDGTCLILGGLTGDGSTVFGLGELNETSLVHDPERTLFFLAKYNPDGTLAWARSIGPSFLITQPQLAGLSDSGWLFTGTVTGPATFGAGEPCETTLNTSFEQAYVFLARYNDDGSLASAKKIATGSLTGSDGSNIIDIGPTGFRAGADGSFVITGKFRGRAVFGPWDVTSSTLESEGLEPDAFVAKYTSTGRLEWAVRSGGPGTENGAGAVILSDNSVLTTGNYECPATFGEGDPAETVLDGADGVYLARYTACGELLIADAAAYAAEVNGIDGALDDKYVITGSFTETATFGPGSPGEQVVTPLGGQAMFVAAYEPGGPAPACEGVRLPLPSCFLIAAFFLVCFSLYKRRRAWLLFK